VMGRPVAEGLVPGSRQAFLAPVVPGISVDIVPQDEVVAGIPMQTLDQALASLDGALVHVVSCESISPQILPSTGTHTRVSRKELGAQLRSVAFGHILIPQGDTRISLTFDCSLSEADALHIYNSIQTYADLGFLYKAVAERFLNGSRYSLDMSRVCDRFQASEWGLYIPNPNNPAEPNYEDPAQINVCIHGSNENFQIIIPVVQNERRHIVSL